MNYTDYYTEAKRNFEGAKRDLALYEMDFMELGDSDVEHLAKKASSFFKGRAGDLSIKYTDSIFDLDLNKIADKHIPEVEKNIFGCNLFVDKVYIYRNVPAKKEESSWLWHYDNNPKEVFKIMVYLTDVDEKRAPFQYVKNLIKNPTRTGPDHWLPAPNNSRVPHKEIEDSNITTVTGRAGKTFIFNPNCVHRATIPHEGFRDVLVLRVRPCLRSIKNEGYVNKMWTTSWEVTGAVPMSPHTMLQG